MTLKDKQAAVKSRKHPTSKAPRRAMRANQADCPGCMARVTFYDITLPGEWVANNTKPQAADKNSPVKERLCHVCVRDIHHFGLYGRYPVGSPLNHQQSRRM